jgi:hypothetical protein
MQFPDRHGFGQKKGLPDQRRETQYDAAEKRAKQKAQEKRVQKEERRAVS